MSKDLIPSNNKFLPVKSEEVNTDFNYTRENLYRLIETAMGGLEELAPLAQQSQNARAFEVLFNAIKTTAELNEKLADHSVKKEDVTKEEKKVASGDTINQHLYVGSTADLQKFLEEKKKAKDD